MRELLTLDSLGETGTTRVGGAVEMLKQMQPQIAFRILQIVGKGRNGEDAVAEGDFTLVDRTDGTKMWAYKGAPLYFWVKDAKPGDTTGDMVGEVWHTAVKQ